MEKVREEITQTIKGMLCASVCPALAVYMVSTGALGGISKAYCGNWESQVSKSITTSIRLSEQ